MFAKSAGLNRQKSLLLKKEKEKTLERAFPQPPIPETPLSQAFLCLCSLCVLPPLGTGPLPSWHCPSLRVAHALSDSWSLGLPRSPGPVPFSSC